MDASNSSSYFALSNFNPPDYTLPGATPKEEQPDAASGSSFWSIPLPVSTYNPPDSSLLGATPKEEQTFDSYYIDQPGTSGPKKKMPRQDSWWERNYNTAQVYAEKRKILSEKNARESIPPPFKAQPMPGFPVPKKKVLPPTITVPCTPKVLKHSSKKKLTTEAAKQGGSTYN